MSTPFMDGPRVRLVPKIKKLFDPLKESYEEVYNVVNMMYFIDGSQDKTEREAEAYCTLVSVRLWKFKDGGS